MTIFISGKNPRGGSRGRVQGVRGGGGGGPPPPPPPPDDLRFSNTTGILPKKTMWFIGVEEELEASAPPPGKNSGSALESSCYIGNQRNILLISNHVSEYTL